MDRISNYMYMYVYMQKHIYIYKNKLTSRSIFSAATGSHFLAENDVILFKDIYYK